MCKQKMLNTKQYLEHLGSNYPNTKMEGNEACPDPPTGDVAPSYPWSLQCIQLLIIHDICYGCLCMIAFNQPSPYMFYSLLAEAPRGRSWRAGAFYRERERDTYAYLVI